ncbi:hypothetical protein OH77DRAFT_1225641 [Trametes cingulata]|nr:hypothetical protein OH77DRAFT_1225641 [Trametes cingulata]
MLLQRHNSTRKPRMAEERTCPFVVKAPDNLQKRYWSVSEAPTKRVMPEISACFIASPSGFAPSDVRRSSRRPGVEGHKSEPESWHEAEDEVGHESLVAGDGCPVSSSHGERGWTSSRFRALGVCSSDGGQVSSTPGANASSVVSTAGRSPVKRVCDTARISSPSVSSSPIRKRRHTSAAALSASFIASHIAQPSTSPSTSRTFRSISLSRASLASLACNARPVSRCTIRAATARRTSSAARSATFTGLNGLNDSVSRYSSSRRALRSYQIAAARLGWGAGAGMGTGSGCEMNGGHAGAAV